MALETFLLFAVALIATCFALKIIFKRIVLVYHVQKLPGPPKYNLFFGNMRPLQDTPDKIFQVLRKCSSVYYPIYKFWIISHSVANIVNPEDLALILPHMKHNKKSQAYDLLLRWLGTGLLTSDGNKWQQRRKILTPAFHFSILQDFILTFNERTDQLVELLKEETKKTHTEINPLIIQLTLKIIGETAMGKKLEFNNKKQREYKRSFHELIEILLYRIFRPYFAYDLLYIFHPKFYKELRLVKTLHEFTKDVISEREQDFQDGVVNTNKKKRLAMLDLLLTAKKEGIIDDNGIREEVDTFMFEGHDTIGAAICFGLMLIACHPKIQEQIVQEMRDVLGDIRKKPVYHDLQELALMERCIKEVLRLYPSVHYISRELGEDLVTHTGYKLKKDTIIQIHIYDLHHNPDIYPDPEKFDPDRFLTENCDKRHPYAYIPFSAGPRNCIGQRFAILEMKAVLCGILGNFVLQPVDTPETITLMVDIVLRTKEPIKVKFVPRAE